MENESFEKSLKRLSLFLKATGIYIDEKDVNRSFRQRLFNRKQYCIHFFFSNIQVVSAIGNFITLDLNQLTYMIPCIILCFLGNSKSYYFISYHHHVVDLINTLRSLQSMRPLAEEAAMEMSKKRVPYLYFSNKFLLFLNILGVATFFGRPFVYTIIQYLKNNELKFILPFLIWYPFDEYSIRIWPIVFVGQLWAAWVAVLTVYAPDCFYYISCVYIHTQYQNLKHDMQKIEENFTDAGAKPDDLRQLIHRHREILRCVNLLDTIFGKSTLLNVLSSSLIICVTGFNLMVIDDFLTVAPFTPFLSMGSVQIFLFCYYGELLMRDSTDISEAVYNSGWYNLNASAMKYCLIILMRAQKPCKITAHGFTDINLNAYRKILSSSWSYFTLLKTIYGNKKN